MSDRVVLLFCDAGRVLLVRRRKDGREYHVLPGGGVEANETLEAAAVREAVEETGLSVVLGERIATRDNKGRTEHYFRVAGWSGELGLGGPERDRQSETNQYHLVWVGVDQLDAVNLVPDDAKHICRAATA